MNFVIDDEPVVIFYFIFEFILISVAKQSEYKHVLS